MAYVGVSVVDEELGDAVDDVGGFQYVHGCQLSLMMLSILSKNPGSFISRAYAFSSVQIPMVMLRLLAMSVIIWLFFSVTVALLPWTLNILTAGWVLRYSMMAFMMFITIPIVVVLWRFLR